MGDEGAALTHCVEGYKDVYRGGGNSNLLVCFL